MTQIKRALVSVSDKTGVVEFAKGLSDAGVEILSTGGTARALREGGVPVVDVSEYTESPEIMDGRVKTLHPRVHGGILMRDSEEDRDALGGIGGAPIDLVCVNLYPFEQTVARGASHDETIENIDIGGPSMVRSAAKNQARVTVVTDPSDYEEVLAAVKSGDGPNATLREWLAAKAFAQTAAYDGAIAAYLTSRSSDSKFPGALTLSFTKAYDVRYGENPHQQGAFYVERNAPAGSLALAQSLGAGGKELSFNNLVDVDATVEAVREFDGPAAVVVKHTNPCGVATASTLEEAYRIAREADAQCHSFYVLCVPSCTSCVIVLRPPRARGHFHQFSRAIACLQFSLLARYVRAYRQLITCAHTVSSLRARMPSAHSLEEGKPAPKHLNLELRAVNARPD